MSELEDRFVEILVESGALLTGDFQLKSGKSSKFFIDFGRVPDGLHLERLGECYAEKILDCVGKDGFDVIYGPAFKGIPIAVAVAIALRTKYTINKRYAFNRKDAKSYGDKRQILGTTIEREDRVVIVDDVFTEGGAKFESLDLLRETANCDVVHVVVGVDRSEPGALERFDQKSGGIPVAAISDMSHVQAAFRTPRGHTRPQNG